MAMAPSTQGSSHVGVYDWRKDVENMKIVLHEMLEDAPKHRYSDSLNEQLDKLLVAVVEITSSSEKATAKQESALLEKFAAIREDFKEAKSTFNNMMQPPARKVRTTPSTPDDATAPVPTSAEIMGSDSESIEVLEDGTQPPFDDFDEPTDSLRQ
eukprot:9500298-Pyramimonas_sp.AAC.1